MKIQKRINTVKTGLTINKQWIWNTFATNNNIKITLKRNVWSISEGMKWEQVIWSDFKSMEEEDKQKEDKDDDGHDDE